MNNFKPEQFGKYLLLDKIGVGGMAELYRAKITGAQGFEKLIAIKKILPHLSSEEALVKSFIDEAKLAAFLQHKNIVQIYDFGDTDKNYFIAMEYLFGKDLKRIVGKSKSTDNLLCVENALYIASRVCSGIEYAHNLKDFYGKPLTIIHRDIGPQNVFVTYDGEVKIIDFGIAKAAIQDTTTQAGSIKGKVAYMSPEQADGKAIDHRSDIFSIGILLYELVTRKRMFEGNTYEIFSKVRAAQFEPPENVNPDLPPKIYDIINKALQKSVDDRYQSASEMLTDLEECMYTLSFRPSARSLSEYMQNLFGEEAEKEKTQISEVASMEIPVESIDEKNLLNQEESHKETQIYDLEKLEKDESGKASKSKGILYVAGIAACVILFFASMEMIYIKNPSSKIGGAVHHLLQVLSIDSLTSSFHDEGNSTEDTSQIDPEKKQALSKIKEGEDLIKEERYQEAIVIYEDLSVKNPLLKNKFSVPYSNALLGLSGQTIKTDKKRAEELIVKAVEINPDNTDALLKLGRLYTKKKEYKQAIEVFQKASILNPENPKSFFNLGYIYAETKDFQHAEEMYKRVVDLSPPYLDEALFNLAAIQKRLGKKDKAIINLEQAITVNPNNKLAKKYLKRMKK